MEGENLTAAAGAAAAVADGASSAECDSCEDVGAKRSVGRGGRREDALGNALGGRQKKKRGLKFHLANEAFSLSLVGLSPRLRAPR